MASFDFQQYYAKNRNEISQRRKKRYQTDAAYRAACLTRSKKQRENRVLPAAEGYTISFKDAAEKLGLTIWTLREWRKKDYFPEPKHRQGRMWFTDNQVLLLSKVRDTRQNKEQLKHTVAWVYSNWSA